MRVTERARQIVMQYDRIMKWPVCLGFGGCQTADTRWQWKTAMSKSVHPSAARLGMRDECLAAVSSCSSQVPDKLLRQALDPTETCLIVSMPGKFWNRSSQHSKSRVSSVAAVANITAKEPLIPNTHHGPRTPEAQAALVARQSDHAQPPQEGAEPPGQRHYREELVRPAPFLTPSFPRP